MGPVNAHTWYQMYENLYTKHKCIEYIEYISIFFCSTLQLNRLGQVNKRIQGVGRCPHDPRQNSTALMLDNGDYFSATTTDFLGRDPAIYRIMGPSKPLRTVQHNNRWLCLSKPIMCKLALVA